MADSLPGIAIVHEPLTQAYYCGPALHDQRAQCAVVPLVDGGAFDWVARLAANRKRVVVASTIGSQLAACLYRTG